MSSYGHIRDLKTKEFSIDIEHDYAPQYVIPADKKKLVSELKSKPSLPNRYGSLPMRTVRERLYPGTCMKCWA